LYFGSRRARISHPNHGYRKNSLHHHHHHHHRTMKYLYGTAIVAACLAGAANSATDDGQSPLLRTALEFVSRASSTSEVLTLNLTNLAILIGLKILFFGFGIFGFAATQAGGGGGLFGGRPDDGDSSSAASIKQSELTGGMCFIMYTSGELDKLSCVQRTACEDPKTATNYLTAAKMWLKMHKLMKVVPFNDGYYNIMNAVEDATEHSLKGGDCSHYKW
jgi:hypothetical protein